MKSIDVNKLNANYALASASLKELLAKGILQSIEIDQILALNNTLIISDFLNQYKHFSKNNLLLINKYIVNNLDNEDRLFVSDLIEFADERDLVLPYFKCIKYLYYFKLDNTYVQLAVIDFINNNLKTKYINVIVKAMDWILKNPDCNQSVQVKAAFSLFRITHKKKYLNNVLELVVNGDENKTLLENMLRLRFNSATFFEYHDLFKSILDNVEKIPAK